MRLPKSLLPVALITALAACSTAHSADPNQTTPAPSQTPPTSQSQAPVRLPPIAEYPSAPHQDLAGNLWFRTVFDGLIRFDGTQFTRFTTKDGLPTDSVGRLIEDADGTLWLATKAGLVKYDGDTFQTLTKCEGSNFTKTFAPHGDHRDLWDVLRDRHGTLWITTLDGVFRHNGKAFERFPLPQPAAQHSYDFTPRMVYCIYEDRAGTLWFGTDGAGVVSYDGSEKVIYTQKSHGLASDRVTGILQDSRGDFWFGTSDGGVSRFNGKTFTTHLRSDKPSESMGWGRVMSILEDNAGDVWFAAAGPIKGAYRFDGKAFHFYSTAQGLGSGHASSLTQDKSGALWIGTTAGVYRFDGKRFVHFPKDAEAAAKILKQAVTKE